MTGALALLAGAALLATGSLRLAARLAPAGTAPLLLGAYVIAWAQLVLVLWALSLFGWVERWPLLLGLAVTTAALVVDTRGRRELGPRLRDALRCAPGGPRRAGRARPRPGRDPGIRVRPRARADDAAERLRHDLRPPLACRALGAERRGGLSRLRVCPVRQRVSAARRAGGARDDGARRCRPVRRARAGRGVRRARARCRGGRPRAWAHPRRGVARRAPRRDAPGDRASVVDGPERPRRRLVRRRRVPSSCCRTGVLRRGSRAQRRRSPSGRRSRRSSACRCSWRSPSSRRSRIAVRLA